MMWFLAEGPVATFPIVCALGSREGFLLLLYHFVTFSISVNINRYQRSETEKGGNCHY